MQNARLLTCIAVRRQKHKYTKEDEECREVWDLSDKGTNRTAAFFCHHVIISRSYFTYATDISFFTRPHIFIANRHEM